MKQMKLFLVVLMTLVMGMSVTSCMKGDDNTDFVGLAIAECTNTYPPTFALSNGQKLVLSGAGMLDLNYNEMYMFYYQFDTAQQPYDSPSLNVTLYSGSTPIAINAKSMEGPMELTDNNKADVALHSLGATLLYEPGLFSLKTLIIPFRYWVKVETDETKQKEELAKHSFVLTYDLTNVTATDTELKLVLNQVVNDGEGEVVKRDRYTEAYKAYNIDMAVYAFKQKTGKEPKMISVRAMVNPSNNSLTGSGGNATEQKKELEYKAAK